MPLFAPPIRDASGARPCLRPLTQREESRDRVRERSRAMSIPSMPPVQAVPTSSKVFDIAESDAEETLRPAMGCLRDVRAEAAGESESYSSETADPAGNDQL